MAKERTLILNHKQIAQKIRRIAYQIHEFNYLEKELVLIAIEEKGGLLMKRLLPVLEEISDLKIRTLTLKIDKRNPLKEPVLSGSSADREGKSVVLIDDVLNSGRTLMYAACHVLKAPVKKLSTVVLIDRRHRLYPVKADFVGLTLSTTLQDHIEVEFKEGNDEAYLEE